MGAASRFEGRLSAESDDGMKRLLTPEEHDVLKKLGECFSDFVKLPVLHPADEDEFMRAIHAAQNIVLARPAFLDERKRAGKGELLT